MPLALATIGDVKTVLDCRCKDEVKRHLYDLGFIKGEKVQIIGENQSGMIVLVKNVRIALNKGIMSKIIVE